MADNNPYQSPESKEPVLPGPGQALKRGLSFGIILLLTPLAVFVTFFSSCWAAIFVTDGATRDPEWLAGAICFAPPAAVLVGMIFWAAGAYKRQHERARSEQFPAERPSNDS